MSTPERSETGTTTVAKRAGIPGHYIVACMILVGLSATAGIFVYWDLHTGPFRPLTEAIGRELPHSLPKVEGGRHKDGPSMLRIAIRVPFEPDESSVETQAVVNQVVRLSREHADLSKFTEFRLHVFQLAPERVAKQASFVYPISQVRDQLPFPDVPEPGTTGDLPAPK